MCLNGTIEDTIMHVLKVLDSEEILQKLGYTYHKRITPKIEPERASIRFLDIVPELIKNPETQWIANQYLYKHQLEALRFLDQGYNIILKSGTGSGKTEAWFFYFFNKAKTEKFKAIAIYPTLALANDQIKRISGYASTANIKVLKLDALQRDEYIKRLGISGLRKLIAESDLVITNPAFLHHEIKKLILNPSKSLLYPLFRDLNLLVIDELDFYGPRSVALLLALTDIIAKFSSKDLQVAILTATLANPEDMCRYLEDITKRKCAIISGLPFAVENRSYIVLGKNLRDIWIKLQQYLHRIAKYRDVDKDVIEALKDFEQFKNNAYRVVSYLEALGFEVPSLGLNPIEILASYANDDGVTLVFTRSIARAEEIAKALKSIVGDKVASHHHLVPKKLREEIEERARLGDLKIIVSPRTLTQGIDIGTVIRVVHIGLPEDVREFFQREGRKGRRQEIPFTESIIIPSTRWDWELLSKGFKALEK
ncbi:MAG TPA: DEAD/DEAH box helicase, partial [Ignisphaera sp.]|nr:DEAD/DEAH box helicase [Ignisphaera sp.]